MSTPSDEILKFTKEIIVAHVSHNTVDSESLPALIRNVHLSLIEACNMAIRQPPAEAEPTTSGKETGSVQQDPTTASPHAVPAVSVTESVTPDYIICLEDGRPFKMMKRWLRATYGLTPEQYRAKWNLPADYPMVAPNYAKSKSVYAKAQGLGTEKLRRADTQHSRRAG